MILLSHPTGNEFVRQALIAFDEAGMLGEFWTTLSWSGQHRIHRFLPESLQQLLERRSYPVSIRNRTHTAPLRELGRLLAGAFDIDDVNIDLDRKVAARLRSIDNFKLVYAYEDAALESFRAAQESGIHRVYDLPIGYWRAAQRIFAEEAQRKPEWASTLTGTRDGEEKLARKDDELRLAERIVVASTFTKKTLAGSPAQARIDIIPCGAPAIVPQIRKPVGPLKLLFAGSLGQRKGLSYLLEAVTLLKTPVELTLLGRKTANKCRPLETATRKHRWIPTLHHAGMLREMHEHDLLVFPSLFEGFGLVVLEAMAQGTPVITTEHTCGPDVIDNETDGFIVPIRSAEAIAEKIELLNADRERLMSMKDAARRKAEAHPWKTYRERLLMMAQEVMGE
jgi:starch synthase